MTDGRTDGWTDRQTPHDGIGRACIASRGKNGEWLSCSLELKRGLLVSDGWHQSADIIFYWLLAVPSWHHIHGAKAVAAQRRNRCSLSCWRRLRRYVTSSGTHCDCVVRRPSEQCRWPSPRQLPAPTRAARQHHPAHLLTLPPSGQQVVTSPFSAAVAWTEPSGEFFEHLLELIPLTLTDPRTAAKKWVMT